MRRCLRAFYLVFQGFRNKESSHKLTACGPLLVAILASVLGTAGYSLCCPGERYLNTSIFKLFSSFFPCRPVITVVIKSCSGIIVTNIVLYGPYVHIRINKRCYFYNLFTKQKTYLRKLFSQDACGGFYCQFIIT